MQKIFCSFRGKGVDKCIVGAILKLAPGNAGSHQVLVGEPPLLNAQGEAEKNRKTGERSGNETDSADDRIQ